MTLTRGKAKIVVLSAARSLDFLVDIVCVFLHLFGQK